MTKTQQKALLFVPVIVISSYVVHSFVIDGAQALFYLFYWRPQPPKAKVVPPPKAPPKVAAAVPPPAAKQAAPPVVPAATPPVPSEFTRLVGIWRGHVALVGRGECDLRFELHPKEEPGKFVGYSSFTCVAAGPLVAKPNNGTAILNRTNPEAAILSGAIEKGSIRFTVDKVVGADSNGCAPSSFALTPFGQDRLAADWEEPGCSGGHLVLMRVVR